MGKLIIFSAPSGAGKTTIVKHLLSSDLDMEFSISATSRAKRGSEKDRVDYYFLSPEEFRSRIGNGDFVEWEEVYQDHYYGTLKSEIDRIWSNGKNVLFDIDVEGGINLKNIYNESALSIFIMPPSVSILKERLISRGTDSAEKIDMRINKANQEIDKSAEFDKIVINDNLEEACDEVYNLVKDFAK